MKLWGDIIRTPQGLVFESNHCDGTPFSLPVFEDDVQITGEFEKNKAQGWLFVIQEGQQDVRCYLSLPRPSLQFGKHITVNQSQLDTRAKSVNDFKPRVLGKTIPVVKAKENIIDVPQDQPVLEPKIEALCVEPKKVAKGKINCVSIKKEPIVENVKKNIFSKEEIWAEKPLINGKKKDNLE